MIWISIIIPFYNVEKYIAQCLDSVYQQDLPEEKYEVICVNDASPDHSRDIVLEYQRKHTNLVLVEHEVNKKLGAARNTGRKVASGKYIWNVDSDDRVMPNCFGKLLAYCEKFELDVLIFQHKHLFGETEEDENQRVWSEMATPVSGKSFWKKQCLNKPGSICPVWNKFFRREYLERQGIFSPPINMGEDVPFSIEAVLRAETVFTIEDIYYLHRVNPSSLARSLKNNPSPEKVYENSFVCGRYIHEVVKRIPPEEKEIRRSVKEVERYTLLRYLSFLKSMTEKDASIFRMLCLRGFFTNRFVFKVFGRKKTGEYISFILLGIRR